MHAPRLASIPLHGNRSTFVHHPLMSRESQHQKACQGLHIRLTRIALQRLFQIPQSARAEATTHIRGCTRGSPEAYTSNSERQTSTCTLRRRAVWMRLRGQPRQALTQVRLELSGSLPSSWAGSCCRSCCCRLSGAANTCSAIQLVRLIHTAGRLCLLNHDEPAGGRAAVGCAGLQTPVVPCFQPLAEGRGGRHGF